jgi:hypothetical protein
MLQRDAKGDFELEKFLEPRQVSIDDLYEFGILKDDRGSFTTADFFVHQVTDLGRRYLAEDKAHQLIFVRRDEAVAFTTFLSRAKSSHPQATDGRQ